MTFAVKLINRLAESGVGFGYRAYWLATGKPVAPAVDLLDLPTEAWDGEFIVTWLRPAASPNPTLVAQAYELWSGSEKYRGYLEFAYCELQAGGIA